MTRTLPAPNPEVVYKAVSDGGVLLSTRDEVYYGLNAVAARIWELLPGADTLDELSRRLSEEYTDVDLETLRSDVEQLLDELASHGLVAPTEAVTMEGGCPKPGQLQ